MTTGEKIRQQRKMLDMKQEDLSRIAGVSLKTIQRWENGERSPRLEEVSRLSEALRCTTGYLMGSENSPVKSDGVSEMRNTNIAVITLDNGRKVEAPATPEGYAFLKEVFAMSLAGAATA